MDDHYLCEKCREEERIKNPGLSIDILMSCNHNQPEYSKREDFVSFENVGIEGQTNAWKRRMQYKRRCGALNTTVM